MDFAGTTAKTFDGMFSYFKCLSRRINVKGFHHDNLITVLKNLLDLKRKNFNQTCKLCHRNFITKPCQESVSEPGGNLFQIKKSEGLFIFL